jgi:hypothetical protein
MGIVAPNCNLSTWEEEAQVSGQLGIHGKTPSLKKIN